MTPTWLTAGLAVLFGTVSLWLESRMGSGSASGDLSMRALDIGFSLWMISPYALLVLAARFGKFRTVTWGAPAVLALIGFYGNLAYADVNFHFWAKSDAQEGLIFLVMPFVQNVVTAGSMGLLMAIGAWLDRRKRP
jgi:hypothetical protein